MISNPALKLWSLLVGTWQLSGSHPLVPGVVLQGQAKIEWLEEEAFLIMHSQINDPRFPKTVVILGSDDAAKEYFMMHFDDRGVSRKYETSFDGTVWKWWRNAPGFSQRYSCTLTDGGNTMIGKGELSKDGSTWEKDLDLTYTRVR